ncbi:MAG: hypothetical protein ACI4HI_18505 [Lachnospiraceae bacterium]
MWETVTFMEGTYIRELENNYYEIYEIVANDQNDVSAGFHLAHVLLRYEDIDITNVCEAHGCKNDEELFRGLGNDWKKDSVLIYFDIATQNGAYRISEDFNTYHEAYKTLCMMVPEIKKDAETLEIANVLTLSTGHVTRETSKLLDNDAVGVVVYTKGEYGWFILTCDWKEFEDSIPEDLKKCIDYAAKIGCDLICLDPDGAVIKELPTYKW